MQFEWDEEKNRLNIQKHGIDFHDVIEMFDHPMLVQADNRDDYGEYRWVGVGMMKMHAGVVVYTERVDDVIRIISARKANKYEVKGYAQYIQN